MRRAAVILAILGAALAAAPASAQVTPINSGQILDANYQIGSGGYNTVVGGVGGVNPQLIMNRQSTGLSSFHTPLIGRVEARNTGLGVFAGPVIPPANELRLTLPTSSLTDFDRQSVGATQVIAGGTYRTAPYYSASKTLFGVAGITSGMTAPGSSAAVGQNSAVTVQRAWNDVVASYTKALPLMTTAMPPVTEAPPPVTPAVQEQVVSQPGAVALFGVPNLLQREQLARELIEQKGLVERIEHLGETPAAPGEQPPEQPGAQPPEQPGQQQHPKNVGGKQTLGQPDNEELAAGTRGGRIGAPQANQDVLLDVLMTLQRQRQLQQRAPGAAVAEAPPSGQGNIVEMQGNQVVLHSLAGKSRDAFNTYMTQAQQFLKRGQYYEAGRQYEAAGLLDPANPMARIGAALAYFTAGEAYSSGVYIKWAIDAFPPIMETRLDLGNMVKLSDLDSRLKVVDDQLATEKSSDAMMMLMAAYLHQNRDGKTPNERQANRAMAQEYARRLLETPAVRGDAALKLYCQYILTGKLPTTLPATSPARPR